MTYGQTKNNRKPAYSASEMADDGNKPLNINAIIDSGIRLRLK